MREKSILLRVTQLNTASSQMPYNASKSSSLCGPKCCGALDDDEAALVGVLGVASSPRLVDETSCWTYRTLNGENEHFSFRFVG
jgi:hypothetical protein